MAASRSDALVLLRVTGDLAHKMTFPGPKKRRDSRLGWQLAQPPPRRATRIADSHSHVSVSVDRNPPHRNDALPIQERNDESDQKTL
jgi:hypothetical protein